MDCKELQIQQLLPDYISGHLCNEDISILESHISDCTECQKLLNVMQMLSKDNTKGPKNNHPSTDELANYVGDSGEQTKEFNKIIAKHISTCQDCAAGVELLKKLDQDEEILISQYRESQTKRSFSTLTILDFFRKPVIAYILLLLFAYPAYLGLREVMSKSEVADYITYDLKEMRRSVNSIPSVGRYHGNPVVKVSLPFYHLAAERDYSIVVADASGIVNQVQYISNFSTKGEVTLLLDTKTLVDGEYILIVNEINQQQLSDTIQRAFPFKLFSGKE